MTSQSGGGGVSTLSGDTDVALTNPAAGAVLGYDGTHWINYPFDRVHCHNTVAFSVPNNAATVVTFDTNDYDTDSMHSTVTNTSRVTIKKAGNYLVGATIEFAASATGVRQAWIKKNGAGLNYGLQATTAAATGITDLSVCVFFLNCIIGDFFELSTYQSSGGALSTDTSNGAGQTCLWATQVP